MQILNKKDQIEFQFGTQPIQVPAAWEIRRDLWQKVEQPINRIIWRNIADRIWEEVHKLDSTSNYGKRIWEYNSKKN